MNDRHAITMPSKRSTNLQCNAWAAFAPDQTALFHGAVGGQRQPGPEGRAGPSQRTVYPYTASRQVYGSIRQKSITTHKTNQATKPKHQLGTKENTQHHPAPTAGAKSRQARYSAQQPSVGQKFVTAKIVVSVYVYGVRCATTSSKGYCAVLCTEPVLPLPSNRPFAVSLASRPVLELQQMAPLLASRPEGTSSWSSRGASPSQMSLWCTRSPRISTTGRHRRREQQPHTVTTKRGPPTHVWSRMVTSSSPSLWSRTDA
jgi:hypothetical protein